MSSLKTCLKKLEKERHKAMRNCAEFSENEYFSGLTMEIIDANFSTAKYCLRKIYEMGYKLDRSLRNLHPSKANSMVEVGYNCLQFNLDYIGDVKRHLIPAS